MTLEQIEEFVAKRGQAKSVVPSENIDQINFAMSLPFHFLISSDERFFEVIDWYPNVSMEEPVTISCKLLVKIPNDDKKENHES